MPRPLVVVSIGCLALAAACGRDATTSRSTPRVVVRGADPVSPPGDTRRDGVEVGPREAAPEIVILPESKPEETTRVVRRTTPEPPAESPSRQGTQGDLTGAGAALPTPREGGSTEVLLPAEKTALRVAATTAISTDESRPGDPVSARVTQPVVVDGEVVIPEDSRVEGRVTRVDQGDYPLRRPSIDVVYDRIDTPDGRSIPIDARTSGEVGTVVQHPRGDHARMRNILLGAGAGAGVGGATGGKRGALAGAIAGAAIGAGVGHGGVDWCSSVRPGDEMTVIFNRGAVVPRGPVIMNLSAR